MAILAAVILTAALVYAANERSIAIGLPVVMALGAVLAAMSPD